MATIKSVFSLLLITLIAFSLLFVPLDCTGRDFLKVCEFDAIYQLGDSISDTGNLILQNPSLPFFQFPYGKTYFKNATGRCSNGLLMIDFIAQSAGIPLLSPYLNKGALFAGGHLGANVAVAVGGGVNFAVADATALPMNFFGANFPSFVASSSLNVQLDWMSTHFHHTYHNHHDCAEKLKSALFIVGGIGGNDYNIALLNKTVEEARYLVPQVVKAIKDAITRVIGYGAVRVVVPGQFPIGCSPIYLTKFHSANSAHYDEFHCLKGLNNLSIYHNDQLKLAIEDLRIENPNVVIVYGDYYNAFQWVYRNAQHLGFDVDSVLKSCCGAGGAYDFFLGKMCGIPGVPVCANPDERVSWDGIHLTHKANQYLANWIINDIFPKLHCKF
ncbi:hypothetical protein RGQ29_013983 [Quercus rubra]|uniref:Acetylajmalan esterase-like n=1 Tax=Quercus rubra TaxID=3512 RepID=A0AAN7FQM8_QUERU|nr:hypothetical protein RGQ29_013983 [Quercus rubra]